MVGKPEHLNELEFVETVIFDLKNGFGEKCQNVKKTRELIKQLKTIYKLNPQYQTLSENERFTIIQAVSPYMHAVAWYQCQKGHVYTIECGSVIGGQQHRTHESNSRKIWQIYCLDEICSRC